MDPQGKQSPSEGMTGGARKLLGRGREDDAVGGNIELIQFLHRLRDQDHHIIWLIGVYGPLHRVGYSLSRGPDVVIVSTLRDCLGLQDIFVGELVTFDAC